MISYGGGFMDFRKVLESVDLFEGLGEQDLDKVATICQEKRYHKGDIIAREGEAGDELYIITDGFVEVLLGDRPKATARVVVSLGTGQIIGEMSLLDQGPRSASIRAVSEPTIVQVVCRADFENLCQQNTNIGYAVMRNLAADLSFKLRHRNLMTDR
jgi:CRP/FNR family transcriptional regulator/CRP/FNR family cyclic AMP-dependent transcriptional regulator